MTLVADTSALVSLGCAAGVHESLVVRFFAGYAVYLPSVVIDELEATTEYEDRHGRSARGILDPEDYEVRAGPTNPDLPLEPREIAAVGLANELEAEFCYCDEFAGLAVIHASLVTARLVTTPRLLEAFVLHGELRRPEAAEIIESISDARNWAGNAYVQQARTWFDESN